MVKPILLLPVVGFAFRLVVLVMPLPLLAATSSPIASCPESEIKVQIGKLSSAEAERRQAIDTLSQCSNAAGALIWELENSGESVRSAAGEVLGKIGTPAVIERLSSDLSQPAAMTRLYAAKTLGQIGWEAKSAVPALVRVSQRVGQAESDLRVRSGAIQALSDISDASVKHSQQLQDWWRFGDIDELRPLQEELDALLKALKEDKQDWPTKAKDLETLQFVYDGLQSQIETLELDSAKFFSG